MPGYTCMVVPSAVQFAGLKPIYADIDPATYNLDLQQVEAAARQDISALIVQHTYGIPCNMMPLSNGQRRAESRSCPQSAGQTRRSLVARMLRVGSERIYSAGG